ncbi:MAG: PEP-CTERM sorting domain-containing protein [Phycisphaerae bacterium]
MKRLLISAVFASLTVAAHAGTDLLDDGSFNQATPGGLISNSNWLLTANFPDPNAPMEEAAQFQGGFANAENGSGGPGDGGNGIWFKSFLGMRAGDPNIPGADADITQSVMAPVDGDYILNFVAGREANFTASEFYVSLSSDGTGGSSQIDLLTASMIAGNIGGAASPALGGNPFSLTLLGVSAGDMLTVSGVMVDGVDFNMPGGQSAFLDRFALTLVPEPSSIALLSLAGAGLAAQRRCRA